MCILCFVVKKNCIYIMIKNKPNPVSSSKSNPGKQTIVIVFKHHIKFWKTAARLGNIRRVKLEIHRLFYQLHLGIGDAQQRKFGTIGCIGRGIQAWVTSQTNRAAGA